VVVFVVEISRKKKNLKPMNLPIPPKPNVKKLMHKMLGKGSTLEDFIAYKEEKERLLEEWGRERYRVCARCEEIKNKDDFYGNSAYCKVCNREMRGLGLLKSRENRRNYDEGDLGVQFKCAKQIIYCLKKMGLLASQPCEVCGSEEEIHAHHDDYNKPTEVRWLCKTHHNEWHLENEPKYVGE
jgi:hypothetical protein